MTNWEGAPGTPNSHHTAGDHRAWCLSDVAWCYPGMLCHCCDQLGVPAQWKGLETSEVLADLRRAVEALPHAWDCDADKPSGSKMPCDCPIEHVLALIDGKDTK